MSEFYRTGFHNTAFSCTGIPRHDYGCRGTGVRHEGRWEKIPEMVPELVVPKDLEDFPLKPYVSYRTREINQEELTSKVKWCSQ